ncbi:MAG: lipid-A-disaccharide synthase [bacterium]|nr:lipid-A-disaccharide synthase [bacterium]
MTGTKFQQIMIIAGEVSGDLHASGLIREFNLLRGDCHFFGVGGDLMADAGCENLYSVREVAFLGFVEVIRHLPFIRKMMNTLVAACLKRRPQVLVLVDYPGFNLRFAARLRKYPELKNLPILYYVSPQVWAWHSSRIPQIARLVNRMAVIFDFEAPLYESVGLRTDFVGHPLLDNLVIRKEKEAFRQEFSIKRHELLIALLPGSRKQEVSNLLPIFLQAYELLKLRFPNLHAMVGGASALSPEFYTDIMDRVGYRDDRVRILSGQTYDLVNAADLALVASGTATLETAIIGTPLIMAYKMSPLSFQLAKHLVKIPNVALVNIVAGKQIVPECLQRDAVPDKLADEAATLLTDPVRRKEMIAELAIVKQKLGAPGASKRVAAILQEMIGGGTDAL